MSYTYPTTEGHFYMYDAEYQQHQYSHANSSDWTAQTYQSNGIYLAYPHPREPIYPDHCIDFGPQSIYSGHDKELRYMSPSEAYSSPYTEASTPVDSSSTISITYHNLANSPCSFDVIDSLSHNPVNHTVKHSDQKIITRQDMAVGMPFESQSQERSYPTAPHSRAMSEYELFQHDLELGDSRDKSDTHVGPFVPVPQEVEYTVTHTETTSTPVAEISSLNKKRPWQPNSDEEEDSEDESTNAAHDTDSDFTETRPKPKRRRSSRASGTTRPKLHSRNISSTSARKGQHTSVNAPNTATTPTKHRRQASKTAIKRPKFLKQESEEPVNKTDRSFPCAFHHFGCTSEFPNKNEWKRHVACQHLQLGFYRCILDGCDPETQFRFPGGRRSSRKEREEDTVFYNDFNRKDLFTQHARRMHGPSRNPSLCSAPPSKKGILTPSKEDEVAFERQLDDIRRRCWQTRRKAPSRSNCMICNKVFDSDDFNDKTGKTGGGGSMSQGPPERQTPEEKAWEERMEHMSKHYEKSSYKKTLEEVDEDLAKWGLETGVLVKLENGKAWLVSLESQGGSGSGTVSDEHRKTRRQPSRTAVRQTAKQEDEATNEHAVGTDDEDAPAESD